MPSCNEASVDVMGIAREPDVKSIEMGMDWVGHQMNRKTSSLVK